MATGSRRYLAMEPESQWAESPAVPIMVHQRNNGGSGLVVSRSALVSGEFRTDRMIPAAILGNNQVGLEIPFELSMDSFDDLLEAALFGQWTPVTGINPETLAVSVAVVAAGKTYTRASGSFLTDGWAVGDYVTITGFVNAANNVTRVKVSAIEATVMTLADAPTLVNETLASGSIFSKWRGLGKSTAAVTVTVAKTARTFVLSAGAWDTTYGLAVGDYVTFSGFTEPENNTTVKILTISTVTLTATTAYTNLHDESTVANIRMRSSHMILKAGVAERSFHIEEGYSDILAYRLAKGMEVASMSLNLAPNAFVSGSFNLVGTGADSIITSPRDATITAAPTTDPFSPRLGSVKEATVASTIVTAASLSLNNGLEAKTRLFSADASKIGVGRSDVNGSITFYTPDLTKLAKYLAETESSLEFSMKDVAGNELIMLIPALIYTNENKNLSENDLLLTMSFQAKYDDTELTNLVFKKIPI
jgi:hypothetical protein